MKKRSGIAPLIAIGGILLALSVGSFFLTPDRAFSENENRYLQLTPRLTWDRIMSGDFMEDVEDYTSDQIVFRDFWTASRSVLQRAEGKEDISGTYLGADGRYFAKVTDDSFDWVRLKKNAGYIRDFFAASGKPCTALIVPSPAGILRDMLPENAPYFNEDKAFGRLGDILGGLHVTIGILAAVNARTITGKGQRVDVSLMDSMIAATENTALKYIETGNIPAPMGNRYAAVSPYDSFTCKGGKVIIAAGNQKLYEKLCNEVLERPDMITDPRFVDMPGRLANQDAIAEVIEERIKDLTPNEAAELVLAHGIPAGPIMNIKEILDDPHVKEREMFVEMDHPTLGKVTVNGCAIKLMDTKPSVRTPAPQLGQNNRDIFEGVLGMTEEQFNTLHEKQVF